MTFFSLIPVPPAAASRRLPPFPCANSPFLPPGPSRRGLSCAKQPSLPPGLTCCGLLCAKRSLLHTVKVRLRLPVCKKPLSAPGSGSRALCRQAASSGRDSVRYAHSGPSQRLRRPRCAGTCIRRAPPPARVRGWTRPPAAASRRLPPSPFAKQPILPPGQVSWRFSCAKSPFLPPAQARHRLPGANSHFLHTGLANWGRKESQSV